jgi:lipopolysaccharide biosynthesis glycosyltransferase
LLGNLTIGFFCSFSLQINSLLKRYINFSNFGNNQGSKMIRITIGYDEREAIAYHTFCQSILEKSSQPLSFTPLVLTSLPEYTEKHLDGSNSFIYSRFLTPSLFDFQGWAIFADGDMICQDDIAQLWALRDETKAVMCAKHDYRSKVQQKYLGNKNQDYPRKNWSSVVLWNCGHPDNRILTPEFVQNKSGSFLHRFSWLKEDQIGEIDLSWNWLTTEYPDNYKAKLLHFTLGTPCFEDYWSCEMSEEWHSAFSRTLKGLHA